MRMGLQTLPPSLLLFCLPVNSLFLTSQQDVRLNGGRKGDDGALPNGHCPTSSEALPLRPINGFRQYEWDKYKRSDRDLMRRRSREPLILPSNASRTYFEGTAYAFAELASMAFCGTDGEAKLRKNDFECELCKKAGFQLKPSTISALKHDSTVVTIAKLDPVSDISQQEVNHMEMSSGCLVTIRGSIETEDFLLDFAAWKSLDTVPDCDDCQVHSGWWTIWKAISPQVEDGLAQLGCTRDGGAKVYFTGHSLGGAVATVGAYVSATRGFDVGAVITFESPRVGNAAFQRAFNNKLEGIPSYRITHRKDPVVHVPFMSMDYVHVNTEIFYEGTSLNGKVCTGTEDTSCANQYDNWDTLGLVTEHCTVPYITGCDICAGCGNPFFN